MLKTTHMLSVGGLTCAIWAGLGFGGPKLGFCDAGFASAESLFTGLAFAGVVATLLLQRQQMQEQRRESLDTTYGNRVDSLVSHYRSFFEPGSVQARRLAWPCIQRTYYNEEFQQAVAAFSHVPKRNREALGSFFVKERPSEGSFSWHHAVHQVDEVLGYFSTFAMRIRSVGLVIKDYPELQTEVRELVRRMNVYWPWWGPALRYVVQLRKEHATATLDSIYGALDFVPDFDLLDDYLLMPGKAESTTSGSTGARILEELYHQDARWQDCDEHGKPVDPIIARHDGYFTVEKFLNIKSWPDTLKPPPPIKG